MGHGRGGLRPWRGAATSMPSAGCRPAADGRGKQRPYRRLAVRGFHGHVVDALIGRRVGEQVVDLLLGLTEGVLRGDVASAISAQVCCRMAVISAVGTRHYYLDRGFSRGELYLVKELRQPGS